MDLRRSIPSVDRLLASEPFAQLLSDHPRAVVIACVQDVLERARRALADGGRPDLTPVTLAAATESAAVELTRGSLRTVINATGVILHTNLGRAPLAPAAIEAMAVAAAGYTNLEYDLDTGARGSRYAHCRDLLAFLTGAEDALVVNNNAAALVLALNTLARGLEAVVSRGELVEIGGAFRVPEIMSRSGSILREVGSTNRTHLHDYREALSHRTGVLLKVHPANFSIAGYTAEVTAAELGGLAREMDVPLVHDIGSGLLLKPASLGLPDDEPWVPDAVKHAHVVTLSGDKLLGGPQCGIVLGSRELVDQMRRNPLCRALRVDKLTLAALAATLRMYLDPAAAARELPVLRMVTTPQAELAARAAHVAAGLARHGIPCSARALDSAVGGGASPDAVIPSWGVQLDGDATATERVLRQAEPPVVSRVTDGVVLLDLRTVSPGDDPLLVTTVVRALSGNSAGESGDPRLTPAQG